MLSKKNLSVALVFSALLFSNMKCKDLIPAPSLPAETQKGARTFGCIVDGKLWLPHSYSEMPSLLVSFLSDKLHIIASAGDETFTVEIVPLIKEGTYNLVIGNNRATYAIGSTTYNCIAGNVEVTKYDGLRRIISGRFSFNGKDATTGKTVSVTDGRFDLGF